MSEVVTPVQLGMGLHEFMELYSAAPFELMGDERILLVPTVAEHNEIIKVLYDLLRDFEREVQSIVVFFESPFVLMDTPDWVKGSRVPDVMVYAAERLAQYKANTPNWRKKPYMLVPDVCIEVISPNDGYLDVDEKVELYLADGVQTVWVVNPRRKTVTVYHAESDQSTRLLAVQSLIGEGLLKGFQCRTFAFPTPCPLPVFRGGGKNSP